MTTYLGKSCSFGLPRVPLVNCRQFMYLVISLGFEGRIWDLIVSVPDHCSSFYFTGDGERLRKVLRHIGSKLWWPWQQKDPIDL